MRRSALLVPLVVAGVGIWLWTRPTPAVTPDRTRPIASPSPQAPAPVLAGRPHASPGPLPPERTIVDAAGAAPPTAGTATVFGEVRAATRILASVPAVVFVVGLGEAPLVLAQETLGEGAAFRLTVPVGSTEGVAMELGARVPGALAEFARLHLRPGEEVRRDLELRRGAAVTGRVVDSEGQAVPDLELMANSPRVQGMTSRVGRLFRTLRPGRLLSGSAEAYQEGRSRTGPDGRFEMTGLAEGEYTFWSPSTAWIVRQTERIPAPSADISLIVDPLAGFSIRVLDDATGEELRSFDGMAEIAAGIQRTAMPVRSEEGADEFLWRELDAERTQGCEVTLRMGSPGYEPRVGVFRIEPVPHPTPITVRLSRPVFVRVAVRATEAGGRTYTGPLRGTVRSREVTAHDRVPVTFLPREPESLTLVAMVPRGSWTLTFAPDVELGDLAAAPAQVDAVGPEVSVDVVFPSWGGVELVRPADPDRAGRGATVVVRTVGGPARVASLLMESTTAVLSALPIGRWTATIHASWCDPTPIEFEVRPSETQSVLFRRR